MELSLTTTSYGVDNLTWLGSREGVDTAQSVTLTTSTFTVNADGFIPSGTALTKDGTTGRYKMWVTGAKVEGFLLTPQRVKDTSKNHVAPMLDRGRIVVANLPANPVLTTTAAGTNGRFVYVGTFAS